MPRFYSAALPPAVAVISIVLLDGLFLRKIYFQPAVDFIFGVYIVTISEKIIKIAGDARQASLAMARLSTAVKNDMLLKMAAALEHATPGLIVENRTDLEAGRRKGLSVAILDRLMLDEGRIRGIAEALREIAALPDPVGEVTRMWKRPNELMVGKMRIPLGTIGIIYESRPNVTADAAALCLKAGNAVILRGGSEAVRSNRAIAACVHEGLRAANLPEAAVQVVETADRAAVGMLLSMNEYVDIIVPRGGKDLIERVMRESRIPMIKHLDGVCHVYIDKGVELRGDEGARRLVPQMKPATEEDWYAEYLAPILAVRVVRDLDQAIEHIGKYGSQHTDAIVTEDEARAKRFLREVDSSSVMVNASTRFADGFEYGLGAEVGISTDKLHARGPVGLEGLTSQKYVVFGSGQIRA